MRLSLRITVLQLVVATISLAGISREIGTSIQVGSGIPLPFTLIGSGGTAHRKGERCSKLVPNSLNLVWHAARPRVVA